MNEKELLSIEKLSEMCEAVEWAAIEIEKKVEEMRLYLSAASEIERELKSIIACHHKDIGSDDSAFDARDELEKIVLMLCKIHADIYSSLENVQRFCMYKWSNSCDSCPGWADKTEVRVVDGELFVRTPLLLNRNHQLIGTKKGVYAKDYRRYFCSELEQKLHSVIDSVDIPAQKNVCMLAIYHRNGMIPDTDNLDTKKIVDALTEPLPGGDRGGLCSFCSASLQTDLLPEGTYFWIKKGFMMWPDPQEMINRLRTIFGF